MIQDPVEIVSALFRFGVFELWIIAQNMGANGGRCGEIQRACLSPPSNSPVGIRTGLIGVNLSALINAISSSTVPVPAPARWK